MGLRMSRLGDRYYTSREKAFERIEVDLQRLQARMSQRQRRRASLQLWSTAAVVAAFSLACYLIYQTQQAQLPYADHFQRVAGAMALPAGAAALHWALAGLLGLLDRRVSRRIKAMEDAKRAMIKELKDACAYERTKALIDKYDPDARKLPPQLPPGMALGPNGALVPAGSAGALQPHSPNARAIGAKRLPRPSMVRPGHMAGAAAAAVGSAGMALVPLIDKLAATLIADNPVLLEDLRRAQGQLEEAQRQAQEAVRESTALRAENGDLKQQVAELQQRLGIAPSLQGSGSEEGEAAAGSGSGGGAADGLGAGMGAEADGQERHDGLAEADGAAKGAGGQQQEAGT